MDTNWLIIILVIIATVALIIFLILRNHKDEKEFMRKLIDEDGLSKTSGHDTEVEPEN